MTKLLFFALSVFTISASAQTSAIITKVNRSGYTSPEYRRYETCEVYLDRVVVTTEMGQGENQPPVTMTRTHPITLSSNIYDMVRRANLETYKTSQVQVCDAPTTEVRAAAPDVPSFPLFESGSCSVGRAERIGGSSYQLRAIVDTFCPLTNDPGGDIEE